MPITPRDLLQVAPKSQAAYQARKFSLPYLTAYTIEWLTRWEIPSTYENISVLNARLFPEEFALVGFPEFPDAMRSNRTLLQMRPKYRGFATSDPRRGVFLTQKGREAAARVSDAIGPPVLAGQPTAVEAVPRERVEIVSRSHTRDPREIVEKAKQKLLFRRYSEGALAEADVVHLLGLLSLYDHTPAKEVKRSFRQLRNDAVSAKDQGFMSFLEAVEHRFEKYLNRAQ